jgi:phospholipase C
MISMCRFLYRISTVFVCLSLLSCANQHTAPNQHVNQAQIQHIVVIYLENHGFDNLYGRFPGAEGLTEAISAPVQVDMNGTPYAILPPVMIAGERGAVIDKRFPPDLPNQPFPIDQYVPSNEKISDLVHRFYQNQQQINHGCNDRFAAISNAGGLTMGYYDGSQLPLWQYAQRYALADHFFQSAYGGSFLNHMWLACACTPLFKQAPDDLRIQLDAQGNLLKDGSVTEDGYAVNTVQPFTPPYSANTPEQKRLPLQTQATIGDRLSEKNIAWAWYSGGWNKANSGKPSPLFQYHHQPFGYFAPYAAGTPGRAEHLKDETDFLTAINHGTLPAVAFYKPIGELNEHPGYADLISGEKHIADLLSRLEKSPQWPHMVVIVAYDENGGFWDHVPPPQKDRWGVGTRVPAIIMSPFAKKGFVDKTEYETTSILKFIETRFGLAPLTERDAKANDLSNALELN